MALLRSTSYGRAEQGHMKSKVVYECQNCGSQQPKWGGQCPECGKWNTLVEEVAVRTKGSERVTARATRAKLQQLADVDAGQVKRVATGISELDRVLGGGLVPGEVILMIGEPGIGKSTLLTQLALMINKTVYVCGEESPGQVKLRVERLKQMNKKLKGGTDLQMLAETDVDQIVGVLQGVDISLLIVDSVQTLSTSALAGQAGNVAQIKETTARLIGYAKRQNVPVVLVGHVTKEGEMAGPKVLEHMVDAVLDLSGDRYHDLRLLRTIKNRFGATDEVGVFRMGELGMEEVSNPSEVFLAEREEAASGSCVTVVMEGTRPVLVEVQALVVDSELPVPRRVAQGVDVRRVQILLGVLQKHARLNLGTKDVFVKVTGGLTIKEPAVDLAVALAVASSYTNKPLSTKAAAVGEVGLLGEIRTVSWSDKRLKEARKLGYTNIYSRDNYRKVREAVATLFPAS